RASMHLLSVAGPAPAAGPATSARAAMPANRFRYRMISMLAGIFVVLQRHLLLELGFLVLLGHRAAARQTFLVGIRPLIDEFLAEQGVAQEIQAEVEQGLVVGDQRRHDLDRDV